MNTPSLFAALLAMASAAAPPEGRATQTSKPPLVFVHGLKGSELVDADGHVQWLTRLQSLGITSASLELPLRWGTANGPQVKDGLRPRDILGSVYIIPKLLGEDVYAPFMRAARDSAFAFHPFAYDWRRDPSESLDALEAFVEKVRAAHGGAQIRLVGHSLGGLLSLAMVQRQPTYFEDAYFAGVPFGGGVGFLQDLTVGTKTGLNKRILSPRVLGTFPSVYVFFPIDGHGLVGSDGNAVTVDYFSESLWKARHWGLFCCDAPVDDDAALFLKTTLERARRFRTLLSQRSTSYPRMNVILANHLPTVNTAKITGDTSFPDFDSMPKVEGDGRVAAYDALLPKPLVYETRIARMPHSELLNDRDIIDWVLKSRSP